MPNVVHILSLAPAVILALHVCNQRVKYASLYVYEVNLPEMGKHCHSPASPTAWLCPSTARSGPDGEAAAPGVPGANG